MAVPRLVGYDGGRCVDRGARRALHGCFCISAISACAWHACSCVCSRSLSFCFSFASTCSFSPTVIRLAHCLKKLSMSNSPAFGNGDSLELIEPWSASINGRLTGAIGRGSQTSSGADLEIVRSASIESRARSSTAHDDLRAERFLLCARPAPATSLAALPVARTMSGENVHPTASDCALIPAYWRCL